MLGRYATNQPTNLSQSLCLFRFRSCPQLSSADPQDQDCESPDSEEHGLGPELCVTGVHLSHGSPRSRPRGPTDDTGRTTPGSRSPSPPCSPSCGLPHVSPAAAAGSVPRRHGTLPAAASRPHARLERSFLGRTASTDSPHTDLTCRPVCDDDVCVDDQASDRPGRPLSQFFDEPPDLSIDGRLTATEDGVSTPLGGERGYQPDHDTMDKCARWLQSLKMTSSSRLKSRSQIQLPPI